MGWREGNWGTYKLVERRMGFREGARELWLDGPTGDPSLSSLACVARSVAGVTLPEWVAGWPGWFGSCVGCSPRCSSALVTAS